MPEVDYIPDEEHAIKVLRQAAYNALDKKRRLGQYAIIGEMGKVRKLEPDEIGEYLKELKIEKDQSAPKPLAKAG